MQMGSFNSWIRGLYAISGKNIFLPDKDTVSTYSDIRDMGLATVDWEFYDLHGNNLGEDVHSNMRAFIKSKKPCLFIFDPKKDGLRKGFLFGVQDPGEVQRWLSENMDSHRHYDYLVTTQIVNPGNGFVGTLFSDGNGRVLCETLHKDGVCNQRELSQGSGIDASNSDFFVAEDFEIAGLNGRFLNRGDVNTLMKQYSHRKGYFEFVNGMHLGLKGIFTTGFSKKDYPQALHECLMLDAHNRCGALMHNWAP